ncbi:hypothetical protein WBG78_07075 [Chryseolinea sp. T2]|uniref:hypothetical protein n=1 Tax=Chryseolinea sp. T2 TaxID=3129255 RepID=UPI00307894B8
MISVLDFARLALLIVVLTFSVQANERAKRLVRERRVNREQRMNGVLQPRFRPTSESEHSGQEMLDEDEEGELRNQVLVVRDTL